MNCCKKCHGQELIKNGHIRGQQRYKCNCTCSFVFDDKRAKPKIAAKRALAVVLYPPGKSGTIAIEQDNSNTCHHIVRMIRRTKVVSKTKEIFEVHPQNRYLAIDSFIQRSARG